MKLSRQLAIPVMATVVAFTSNASASEIRSNGSCQISAADFHGWKAEQLSNRWVQLTIVPQLGGRLMQMSFGGHDFLFINPKYEGQYIPPAQASGKWINYGGDKIWPMPEGDEDDHHWVLKSDPLDDGEYRLQTKADGRRCSATLAGPPDPVTGLQYSRTIGIGSDSPEISFHAVMKNIADHPISWSVQSVTQYNLADPAASGTFNRNFFAFTPVNPKSAYFTGFQVRNGLADDPSFEIRDGIFQLHWLDLENEVWLDSPDGWVAVVDRASNYAVVECFKYERDAEYPGKATVIFYKNGASIKLDENLRPELTPATPDEAPYYMEAELNSPVVSLRPGETYAFDTAWFPTRGGAQFSAVNAAGIVEKPLSVTPRNGAVVVDGNFGVFFPGTVVAVFAKRNGEPVGRKQIAVADPLKPLALRQELPTPPDAVTLTLHLVDEGGTDRGALGEAELIRRGGDAE